MKKKFGHLYTCTKFKKFHVKMLFFNLTRKVWLLPKSAMLPIKYFVALNNKFWRLFLDVKGRYLHTYKKIFNFIVPGNFWKWKLCHPCVWHNLQIFGIKLKKHPSIQSIDKKSFTAATVLLYWPIPSHSLLGQLLKLVDRCIVYCVLEKRVLILPKPTKVDKKRLWLNKLYS